MNAIYQLLHNHFSQIRSFLPCQDISTRLKAATVVTDSPELHTITRLLLSDMNRINEGIYTMNFSLIEAGAAGINNHPPMAEKILVMVKETLGEMMEVFDSYDHNVHSGADSLREADAQRNMNQILDNYRIFQQGCVSCHATLQEEIRHERLRRQTQNRE